MRLTCPNCSAEYEVDASVIPTEGRDVQCSNCSHTWFQASLTGGVPKPPAPIQEPIPAPIRAPIPAQIAVPAPRTDRVVRSRVAVERSVRGATPVAHADLNEDGDTNDFVPPPLDRARKPVDEEVLQVLRAEAEREQRVRRGEPVDVFQDQSELALAGAAPRQSRRIPTDPRDLPDEDLVPSGTIGRRRTGDAGRNVLPDIEEINSTLRASRERPDSVPAYVEVEQALRRLRRGQGFRLGFSMVLAVVAAGMFTYIFDAELTERWPQTQPYIDAFVTQTNALRGLLDTTIREVSDRLTTLITENSG